MSNSLVAIPAGWPGPAAPRCRPTVFYRPGLWPGPGAHWQRPLARTAILMCHGLATELHLNLQIKVIAGCDKGPLLRQLFIRHNKTCKYSYGEIMMRKMIRDILNDPSKRNSKMMISCLSLARAHVKADQYCVLKTTIIYYLFACSSWNNAKIMGCAKFGAVRAASRKNQLRRGATAALRENPVLAC